MYSAETWDLDNCSVIKDVHIKTMKRYIDSPPGAPNLIVYGDCGRHFPYINGIIRLLKYRIQILRMETLHYPRLVYKMTFNSCNQENVVKILFSRVWNN